MKIYFDVCCLNRPFDRQDQPRISLESAAVVRILELIESGALTDHSSEMARIEIGRMSDPDRRRKVSALLPPRARTISLDKAALDAAEEIVKIGFSLADAVHLVAARRIGVDVLLTVDDNLEKLATRHIQQVSVRVRNPVTFLKEFSDEHDR